MLKDQFPDAKYVFRGLIPAEIKLPKFTFKVSLTYSYGSAKTPIFGNGWMDT